MVKNLPAVQEMQVGSWVGKIPWRRALQPTPVFLVGNPMDRGAWQATVHGVTKDRTQLSDWTRTHTIPNLFSQLSWEYLWLSVWGSDFERSSVCAHDLSQSTATRTLCASVSAFQENGYHSLWSFSSVSKVSLVWTPQYILSQAIPSIPPNLVKVYLAISWYVNV